MREDNTSTASRVLRPLRNPNCSCPRRLLLSATAVIFRHIRTVMSLSRFEGMVMGRYWQACRESPPYKHYWLVKILSDLELTLNKSMHFPKFKSGGTDPSSMILFRNIKRYCLKRKLEFLSISLEILS